MERKGDSSPQTESVFIILSSIVEESQVIEVIADFAVYSISSASSPQLLIDRQ